MDVFVNEESFGFTYIPFLYNDYIFDSKDNKSFKLPIIVKRTKNKIDYSVLLISQSLYINTNEGLNSEMLILVFLKNM
jgi:hypothetical protein